LPSAFLALRVFNMKKKKQLNQFANGIKFIMLMGFLFTIIIYLNIHL